MNLHSIASGYYLEALSVTGEEIWFSDVIQGGIQRISAAGKVDRWLPERLWIGGVLLNEDGCALVSGAGGITWLDPTRGSSGMLLDAIDGQPLDGVNEMFPDGDGGLYFGTVDIPSIERGRTTRPASICRLEKNGRVTRLIEGLRFSNGMSLSPDGRKLYHNESFVGTFVHDVDPAGGLGEARMLLDKPDCDGMAVDVEGGIWITGFNSNEVIRLRPDGTVWRRVSIPAEAATNIRFGGTDLMDLYITTVTRDSVAAIVKGTPPTAPTSVLYRARWDVAGMNSTRPGFAIRA